MRKVSAILAFTLALGGFGLVGCESEAPKKPPEQKSDLGTPASPSSATPTTPKSSSSTKK